ncbi:3-oxoacyl-ACP synthase [Paraburkholderia kururiensis]|uniref:3-oxoacyl-[acyl-carrier-protein] synthase III C-terminal domain-containing protein n=1 Tax=Paraburkholderia kururiensis TaxID=984307 RepID=UPI0039A53EE6
MQAVYADTLRWSTSSASSDARDAAPWHASSTADAMLVACESRLSLSDMALIAARMVLEDQPHVNPAPDQIIVCTTSFEHDLALSCACRLHCELGSSQAPFAIGQLQDVSFLMALEVALAMMSADTGLHAILIVAAERWIPPFARRVDPLTVMGDGAAAVLLSRDPVPGWLVRDVAIRTPAAVSISGMGLLPASAATLLEIIDQTCLRAGVRPADIEWIVPASIGASIAHEISLRGGLPTQRHWHACEALPGHLCAADMPARLDALWKSIRPIAGQRALMWSSGFQGQAGCALFEFSGGGA